MLVDIHRCVKPRLYIMDGVVAMEENAHGSGTPVNMNLILFSTDPVALDTVFCHLIYLNPKSVYKYAKKGYGDWDTPQR